MHVLSGTPGTCRTLTRWKAGISLLQFSTCTQTRTSGFIDTVLRQVDMLAARSWSGPHTVHYCTLHCTHYSKFWSALSTQCTANLAHLSALSTECTRTNRHSALSALDLLST